jgi:hypothetical protein
MPGIVRSQGRFATPRIGVQIKSLSLNMLLSLNPPLKKGDGGGFALARFAKIPPPPLYKGGEYFLPPRSKEQGIIR